RNASGAGITIQLQAIDSYRVGDVLQLLGAKIGATVLDTLLDFIEHLAGDANPSRLGDRLQPGRNIDTIAVDPGVVKYNVTLIDADPELHAPGRLGSGVALLHLLLHGNGTSDGIEHAGELGENAVAGGIDDMPAELRNHRQHGVLMPLEIANSPFLVRAHQGAVAGNIGYQKCRKLAGCLITTHRMAVGLLQLLPDASSSYCLAPWPAAGRQAQAKR